jgi:hypothetical protein
VEIKQDEDRPKQVGKLNVGKTWVSEALHYTCVPLTIGCALAAAAVDG